jgi:hypothetical protein
LESLNDEDLEIEDIMEELTKYWCNLDKEEVGMLDMDALVPAIFYADPENTGKPLPPEV